MHTQGNSVYAIVKATRVSWKTVKKIISEIPTIPNPDQFIPPEENEPPQKISDGLPEAAASRLFDDITEAQSLTQAPKKKTLMKSPENEKNNIGERVLSKTESGFATKAGEALSKVLVSDLKSNLDSSIIYRQYQIKYGADIEAMGLTWDYFVSLALELTYSLLWDEWVEKEMERQEEMELEELIEEMVKNKIRERMMDIGEDMEIGEEGELNLSKLRREE